MVCKIQAGISWRDLPERYGSWKTVSTRYRRYALDGSSPTPSSRARLPRTRSAASTGSSRSTPPLSAPTSTPPPPTEKRDQQAGRTRGNLITKIHLACDGRGQPLAILLSGR
ncbi:transposase [Streptomyces chartreusis]|uniref:transposase n=1 Tax=Streptomyces chartreusis TaxID=1969 RepID=UPI0038701F90